MRVLLTGATGLLGNNVLRALLEQGNDVVVVTRENSEERPLEGLSVEKHRFDLAEDARNDGKLFREALDHVDIVIHCAGLIQIGWSQLELSLQVNRDVAAMMADACRMRKVRFIHISTVDALAAGTPSQPATEESIDPPKIGTSYVISKRAADEAVWDQIARGLDGVVIHPGLMFGPWDWKPSSGEMMMAIARQFVPFAPSGGISVCDVRDVAAGILSAMQNASSGESYIMAGENMSYLKLWQKIATLLNRRPPIGKLPHRLGRIVGGVSDLLSKFRKVEPASNSGAIKMGEAYNWYSSEKAKRELGYQIGSVDIALEDACQWFKAYGYLKST